jgi:hypothetical protein
MLLLSERFVGWRLLAVLIQVSVFTAQAGAVESQQEFAECQKMLGKYASWLTEKADNAQRKHGEKLDAMINRVARDAPDVPIEKIRLDTIVERITREYELEHYRRVLVDTPIAEVTGVENTADFNCFDKAFIKNGFKRDLEKYEQVLEEIEEAVEDRLDIERLGPDEGLVVILLYVEGIAEQVDINRLGAIGGGIRFGPIRNKDFFRVFKVKAGEYRWHSIWYKSWLGRMTAHLRHSKTDFTVVAGKLNYSGVFIYKSGRAMGYSTKVADRTSVVLSLLESRYPELVDEFEVHNGLTSDDRFIDFYFNEKRAARSDDDGA